MRTRGLIRVRRAELTEDDDLDAEREGEAGAEDRDAAAKWARSAGALSRSGSSGVPHANVLPNRRGVLRARHSRVSCVRVGLGLAWVAHLIMTSLEHFSHMLCRMMAGRAVAQSCVKRGGLGGGEGGACVFTSAPTAVCAHTFLYTTRETHRSKLEWNFIWCGDLSNGVVRNQVVEGLRGGVEGGAEANRSKPRSSIMESSARSVLRLVQPSQRSLGSRTPKVSCISTACPSSLSSTTARSCTAWRRSRAARRILEECFENSSSITSEKTSISPHTHPLPRMGPDQPPQTSHG